MFKILGSAVIAFIYLFGFLAINSQPEKRYCSGNMVIRLLNMPNLRPQQLRPEIVQVMRSAISGDPSQCSVRLINCAKGNPTKKH